MSNIFFQPILKKIDHTIESKLSSKHWEIKLAVLLFFTSIFSNILLNPSALIHFQQFWGSFLQNKEFDVYQVIKIQSEDISNSFLHFKDPQIDTWSHESKMTFRLFLPILSKVLNFGTVSMSIYVFQIFVGFIYYILLTKFTFKIVQNKTNTFLFLLGFTGLYASNAFFYDITGYGDFFAFLFLLLMMNYSNVFVLFLIAIATVFIDERGLINMLFPLIWWQFFEPYLKNNKTISFIPKPQTLAIGIVVLAYAIFRISISEHFQLLDNSHYFNELQLTLTDNLKNVGLKLWSGFESFWLLVLIGMGILFFHNKKTLLVIWALVQLISIIFAFVAYDTNRGLYYGYLSVFLALFIVQKHINENDLKILLLIIALIAFLFPSMNRMILPGHYTLM
ncbi:MAG: hypothetical protein KA313_08540 [Pseudarcicella sp.]|nr:hypothetical protein [Pseudarcicella sp.]